jgi:hypothetical protein
MRRETAPPFCQGAVTESISRAAFHFVNIKGGEAFLNALRHVSFSGEKAMPKVAIESTDQSSFTIEDISIYPWTDPTRKSALLRRRQQPRPRQSREQGLRQLVDGAKCPF